ncbi:MAG TPA: hypothetical protein VH682_30180 [Gemmataceae bacterium]
MNGTNVHDPKETRGAVYTSRLFLSRPHPDASTRDADADALAMFLQHNNHEIHPMLTGHCH